MEKGIITEQIRRCNRNLLMANLALLAVALVLVSLSARRTARTTDDPLSVERSTVRSTPTQDPSSTERVLLPGMSGAGSLGVESVPVLVVGASLAALALWNVVRVDVRSTDSKRHPIMRSLARYGPSDQIAWEIDAEADCGERVGWSRTFLTRSWLVHPTLFGARVIRLADLVWVYRKVKARLIYDLTTPVSWAAVLVGREGKPIEIVGTAGDMANLTVSIHSRAPWIFTGHNFQMANEWRKYRGAIIREVERRRRLWQASAEAAAPSAEPRSSDGGSASAGR